MSKKRGGGTDSTKRDRLKAFEQSVGGGVLHTTKHMYSSYQRQGMSPEKAAGATLRYARSFGIMPMATVAKAKRKGKRVKPVYRKSK